MADKLISDLTSGPILVTDLLEHEPIAGPPSLKGDVTALFSDASSVLAIDRDNRQLWDSSGITLSIDWQIRTAFDSLEKDAIDWEARFLRDSGGFASVNWTSRLLINSSGLTVFDWENPSADFSNRNLIDSTPTISLDWESRQLFDSIGGTSVDWSSRQLIDSSAVLSLSWEARQLFATDGTTVVLDYSTQQPSSGPQTAGAVYTATEQVMLQEMYDALRAYGLLSP